MKKIEFLYIIRNLETNQIKIGRSKNVEKRLTQLQTANSSKLCVLFKFETEYSSKLESFLHSFFKHKNINGEWFDIDYKDLDKVEYLCNVMNNNYMFLDKHDKTLCY